MSTKSDPPQALEPREPAARPRYPQRDSRAVKPIYFFVEESEDGIVELAGSADQPVAGEAGRAGQTRVQEPHDPQADLTTTPRR